MKCIWCMLVGLILVMYACSQDEPQIEVEVDIDKNEAWEGFSKFYTYENDGLIMNAADPCVLKDDDGVYYLYHTGKGFTVYSSNDLVNWTKRGKAMPNCKWAVDKFWAPEVFKRGDKYYLHYTGMPEGEPKQIGMAISDSPVGPFVDVSNRPFHRHPNPQKEILDSHFMFDDDGRVYMYYNNDMSTNIVGNQKYSELQVIEVESDLSATIGEPTFIGKPEQAWEYSSKAGNYWNEGSIVFKRNDTYYLMYSANCYCGKKYAVGFATSNSPFGPFVKYEHNPVLSYEPYKDKISGPGHHTFVYSPDEEEMIIIYHSHMDINAGGGARMINIDRMGMREDGTIYVNGPTQTPQLMPSFISQKYEAIESYATISSNATAVTFSPDALKDGEFSMYNRFKEYEWVANYSGEEVLVSFEWDKNEMIEEVWVYNSIDENRQTTAARIEFDDGTIVDNFYLKKNPGEATVVSLKKAISTKEIRLYLKTGVGRNQLALSEVRVLARK